MRKYGLRLTPSDGTKFNKSMNPDILASFSTAAYRFGHTLIQGMVEKINKDGSFNKTYSLSDTFFKTKEFLGDGADQIIAGMVKQPIQSRDRFVSTEVSHLLFKEKKQFGKDLIALNIQRGRDHGIPSYSEFYKRLGPKEDPNREIP
jgi:peroxidase